MSSENIEKRARMTMKLMKEDDSPTLVANFVPLKNQGGRIALFATRRMTTLTLARLQSPPWDEASILPFSFSLCAAEKLTESRLFRSKSFFQVAHH